jgi:aspartate kinase
MVVLLSTGEQISIALIAMALEKMGLPVISLTGWQIGMLTNSDYGNAALRRLLREDQKRAGQTLNRACGGFQGINKYDDITTLGRGGSDTTPSPSPRR